MIKAFMRFFYTSRIGGLYFEFLLWLENRRLKREIEYSIPTHVIPQIVKSSIQELYIIGIKRIKSKLVDLTEAKTKEEYKKVLSELKEIISLSVRPDKNRQKYIDNLKRVYVYKDKDIKNNVDKARMIERRINDYKELHNHILQRNLRREIRKAVKNGDQKTAKKLEKEWIEKYAKKSR